MYPGPEPRPLLLAEDWSALRSAVKRFEKAWHEEPRSAIDDFLPVGDPMETRVLIELVHIDLELRLKAGEAARVEEYLARYPKLTEDPGVFIELVAAEHELRQRRESGLTLDEYLGRFPEYTAELLEQIQPRSVVAGRMARCSATPRQAVPPEVRGFEVLEVLGRGGMGVVYRARQHSLDRLVALKFLPEECARDPAWLARFRREARTASALNHPHICTIYDIGESAGRPFLSMELIEGRTLDKMVGQCPQVEELARLLSQAARALAAAHAVGIVHRDIKPANLMVRDDGIVKLLDFGLARHLPSTGAKGSLPRSKITDPGTHLGTPLYMSPEQVRAEPLDTATDIFSLGLVLYELATGRHPFQADSEVGVLHAIATRAPLPPSRLNPALPSSLDALVQHMLAKDRRLRPTAIEVEAALCQLSANIPGKTGRRPTSGGRPLLVGRQREWAGLVNGLEEAASGRGLLLCVTGEPGLGKTTLVESFLEEVAATGGTWSLARGRCSERLAGAEAYLPFLEALDSLLHGEGGAALSQAMKLLAPTWYVQLAPLVADDKSLAHLFAEAKEASQERRKRELGLFLQEASRQHPLVVFLDDIHWADPSSVDLLAYLGSKCSAWRLLLLLAYRHTDLLRTQHPFGPVKLELQGRGICREIALPFLSRDDFDRYLELAFTGHRFPNELAAILHARTEGNPIFMVDLLRYLCDRGLIVQAQDGWELVRGMPDLERELPESVRSMIQRKVDQLSSADRHMLMAASVQSPEFDSAVVAELLGRGAAEVEERLEVLERVYGLVRHVRAQTFPDGTLTVRYRFVHMLYKNALSAALQPTRRAAWNAGAARALLAHYGENSSGLAAELAELFEVGRDYERAADYYRLAAENAARVYGHHEAVALARRGLALLRTLPDTHERARRELPLQMILGIHLQIAHGYAATEAEPIYSRARALCEQLQEAGPLFQILWGLLGFYEVRSDLGKSRELAELLFTLAQKTQDTAKLLQARVALAVTSLSLGDPAATREHMEQGVALYNYKRHSSHAFLYGRDPGVACRAFGAVALWLLGYPDQAVECSREAVAIGRELGQPSTLVLALHFAAVLRLYRREGPAVQKHAEAAMAIATEHGFSSWLANSQIMRGWTLIQNGESASGIAQLRQGLSALTAAGGAKSMTYFFALMAEALGKLGQTEEALDMLSEAIMHDTGERFHWPELHRLRGEFLLRQEAADVACRQAEACFRQAIAIARQQQAKSLELRAAMSLTRLYHQQNRQAEARPMLAECYDWFTEGFDTPDLKEAKKLLEQIS
jgi:predicted ATPase/predicted Ser/Thr protein kinase